MVCDEKCHIFMVFLCWINICCSTFPVHGLLCCSISTRNAEVIHLRTYIQCISSAFSFAVQPFTQALQNPPNSPFSISPCLAPHTVIHFEIMEKIQLNIPAIYMSRTQWLFFLICTKQQMNGCLHLTMLFVDHHSHLICQCQVEYVEITFLIMKFILFSREIYTLQDSGDDMFCTRQMKYILRRFEHFQKVSLGDMCF
jgi:hypothetical protein